MSETTIGAPAAALPEEQLRDVEQVLGRRMELVERENQRLRRLNQFSLAGCAVALGLSAAVLVVAGVGRSTVQAQTVEAERFVLRAPSGAARGEWRMGDGGSSELVLRGGNGKTQVKLGILADGSSGLSLADFQKRITVQELTADGIRALGPVAETLASLEGLDAHARAVTIRLQSLDAAG